MSPTAAARVRTLAIVSLKSFGTVPLFSLITLAIESHASASIILGRAFCAAGHAAFNAPAISASSASAQAVLAAISGKQWLARCVSWAHTIYDFTLFMQRREDFGNSGEALHEIRGPGAGRLVIVVADARV